MENSSENHNQEGHETKEVSVPFVFASLSALIIGAFLVSLLVIGIFQFFKSTYHPDEAAKRSVQQVPPEPRLQVNAPEDLQSFRAREDHMLSSYAIIDQSKGTVRVPIDRAIDMLAQKGLPTHNYLDDILAGRKPPVATQPEAQRKSQGSNNAQ
ncbi:MAG TPA: hypothetical protein VKX49_07710 [Bryobacteraceae bacterium]|nr:hypothetical protein [Bryobacteraceae bacterium]